MSNRLATFAAVLAALWAAHNVGDHLVQTDHQAAGKATSWAAMAGHVGGYQATQAAALAALRPLGLRVGWPYLIAATIVSAATHALLDRRWPVAWLLRVTRSPRFAELATPINGPYLADQACHHACLFVAAWIVAAGAR